MKKGFFELNNLINLMHDYILHCVMGKCMIEKKMCGGAELYHGWLEWQKTRGEDQDPMVCWEGSAKILKAQLFLSNTSV